MAEPCRRPRLAVVVEDDQRLAELAASLLREADLEVIACASGEAASALMWERGGDVALLFADIRLPGAIDGVELARFVRHVWPHVAVILTSGDPGAFLRRIPEQVTFMPKPWRDLDMLVNAHRALAMNTPAAA